MADEEKPSTPKPTAPAAPAKPPVKPSAAAAPKKEEKRGGAPPAKPKTGAAPPAPPAPEHSHGVPGMYSHIREAWKKPHASYVDKVQWGRQIEWRREPAIVRVEHPTRLDAARAKGYKAKQGVCVARISVRRGGPRKRAIRGGRRPKRKGILRASMKKSIQRIAEERVSTKFPNLEVLNSYWVGADGKRTWYEVILLDPHHPVIKSDPDLSFICDPANRGRAYRGLTSAGKKGRGLRYRGKGVEKRRPSFRAHLRRKFARGKRTHRLTTGRPQGSQRPDAK